MSLLERLQSSGPKRMLGIDGGGIRGVMSLEMLQRIEQILRQRHGRPDMRLADYFDLIGGTSTGSVIASCLAIGMAVEEVKEVYLELGAKVFGQKKWKIWEAKYDVEPLEKVLYKLFGERTLGDPSIRTGLCVIAKRADTHSTWPLINHPQGKYFSYNRDILLRQAVRCSAAAPTIFLPEELDVGRGEPAAFVDGGVSMFNNPAMQLFLLATLQGFPFHWKTGADELLLVSVGTGTYAKRTTVAEALDVGAGKLVPRVADIVDMLMADANWFCQLLLQGFSHSPTNHEIDSEVGDLEGDLIAGQPLLSYLRYNVTLEESYLNRLGLPELGEKHKLETLRDLGAGENLPNWSEIGKRAALDQIEEQHFPAAFDIPRKASVAAGS